ncbi:MULTISPECIES: DUF4189 domain-containing protein [Stenotrophomonas]|uniref:DUF4189 domain-containing protein n=1 Tax=Stenotrophomonas nitritireducens TaxID=83617 RepID=A0ABR5NH36_9GAMM|nr:MULTISPECIES: DUF4189 domain-containing protein [Stenotrophomonas]KQN94595.1 hypothetical protein ASF01_17015 [Stenotrophomonas sp. Leaf70]KRG55370.1 hypothetical protein ABB22_14530 [Stenotrophomonas nitritireducens]
MIRTALVIAALLPAGHALAASAVAFSDSGAYGYAYNHPSASLALQAALGHCARRSANCTEVASTSAEAGYSAIASGSAAFGHALGESDERAAIDKALAMCRRTADDCRLEFLWRERPVPALLRVPSHPPMPVPAPRQY